MPLHPIYMSHKTYLDNLYLQHLFINDNDGGISIQSYDLSREITVEIKQGLLYRPVIKFLLTDNI